MILIKLPVFGLIARKHLLPSPYLAYLTEVAVVLNTKAWHSRLQGISEKKDSQAAALSPIEIYGKPQKPEVFRGSHIRLSDCVGPGLAGSDADTLIERRNPYLAVADFSCPCGFDYCVDCRFNEFIVYCNI